MLKDVTIISKVVGRKEGGDRPVTGGGSQTAVDLSAYLLKKTWDTAWELREKDGVPYLFGKLPVVLQSGMTSYVADEAVDLPGIYDGLPIDNQTLKWVEVTDESGAVSRVLVAAGGGTGGGGGSVKFPLTWSGFSNGSWDGSVAMTIAIPSKLSDLENDGFFKDYGWAQGDANEKKFGSHFLSGAVDNIPISNGQLLAFNGADGAQFFVWENHFYHRQNWGGGWHGWRKVISGDSNGVIDYDLTLGGSLNMPSGYSQIKCGENALLVSYSGSTDTYLYGNEHLYLMSKNIFAYEGSEEIYRILHEGNYKNYDYTAKWLSVVDIRNTTPKPSDLGERAITAQFTNTDNPGDGWFSGLSIQGWTNDYKAWQLRSGAWGFASDHLYFRNGKLETWNDWRRVITGDVNGVLDSNLEVKGEEGGNIKFVINPDRSIGKFDNQSLTNEGLIRADGTLFYDNNHAYGGAYFFSEPIRIINRNATIVGKVFDKSSEWAGLVLYDVEGLVIGTLGGNINIRISESYPNAASFRFGNVRSSSDVIQVIVEGHELASIRHALRFPWYDDAYEIGTVRSNSADAWGFGVTYQNNQLVWRVDRERMDVYGDLRIKNGLIRYNEEEGYFYIDGNLVVSGGLTAFADEGAGNQWIMDANSLEEVVSDNPFKVYSAKVVSMIASNITNTKEIEDGVTEALDKLDIIKDKLSGITLASTGADVRDALMFIYKSLSKYVRDTE